MGVIDIIISILFLIFMIIGFVKGFTKQTLSSFAWLIALGAGVFLSKITSNLLFETGIGESLTNKISSWIISKGGEIVVTPVSTLTEEMLGEALSSMGIPYFIHPFLTKKFDLSMMENISIVDYISPKISLYILIAGCFIVIYLIVFLLVKLIAKILGDIIKNSPFGFLDRILGMIWGVVKATFIASIFMLLLSLVMSLPIESVNDWLVADMKIGVDEFGIAKFIYEHNPIVLIIEHFKQSNVA